MSGTLARQHDPAPRPDEPARPDEAHRPGGPSRPGRASGVARRGWSLRARALVIGVAVAIGVLVLAAAGFEHTLTYYRTPTEVSHMQPSGTSIRVAGMVVRGSIAEHGNHLRFRLTDGATDLTVVSTNLPAATFRPGKGAVVEGVEGSDQVFHANRVIVRHSNEYEPAGQTK